MSVSSVNLDDIVSAFRIQSNIVKDLSEFAKKTARRDKIKKIVDPIFYRLSNYDSYEIRINQQVRYPFASSELKSCDLVIFKKPDDQIAFENAATVASGESSTSWSPWYIASHLGPSYSFWRMVLQQEDCLIRTVRRMAAEFQEDSYSCALYDQAAFSQVCSEMQSGYAHHILALFREAIPHDQGSKVIGYIACSGHRIKGRLIEKAEGLLVGL